MAVDHRDLRALHPPIRRFVERYTAGQARRVSLDVRPFTGGLEAAAVADVAARYLDRRDRGRCFRFVVKVTQGYGLRELEVYRALAASSAARMSPRLYDADEHGTTQVSVPSGGGEQLMRRVLFLERVRPTRRWPWSDSATAAMIMDHLAHMHEGLRPEIARGLDAWDFESELARAARSLLEAFEAARRHEAVRPLRRGLPALRRIVNALPRLRRQLVVSGPLRPGLIHGDVHPGNVLLRRGRGGPRPVFIDWARARKVSPLEDVQSWLHSLGFWERETRRRHDSLVTRYLAVRGATGKLGADARGAYWMAGASNALAGALQYHLSVLLCPQQPPATRTYAYRATEAWLRVVRRADAHWS